MVKSEKSGDFVLVGVAKDHIHSGAADHRSQGLRLKRLALVNKKENTRGCEHVAGQIDTFQLMSGKHDEGCVIRIRWSAHPLHNYTMAEHVFGAQIHSIENTTIGRKGSMDLARCEVEAQPCSRTWIDDLQPPASR